jgi:hypothetical protein
MLLILFSYDLATHIDQLAGGGEWWCYSKLYDVTGWELQKKY